MGEQDVNSGVQVSGEPMVASGADADVVACEDQSADPLPSMPSSSQSRPGEVVVESVLDDDVGDASFLLAMESQVFYSTKCG